MRKSCFIISKSFRGVLLQGDLINFSAGYPFHSALVRVNEELLERKVAAPV
jgi:hypothetical protein